MRHIIIIALVFFSAACSTIPSPSPQLLIQLEKLHASQDYFRLRNFFAKHKESLNEEYVLYYQALLNSYFNLPELSNQQIDELFKLTNLSMSDSLLSAAYSAKASNHVRMSEYRQAGETCQLLLDQYAMYFDSLELQDIRNGYIFWGALAEIPKQKLSLSATPEFQLNTDNRGFWNVDVQLADTICPFIFDTGAGTSLIKKSIALQSGYHIIQLQMPVRAFTGRDVKTNLAIAETITIGGATFDHVIFLVVDDEQLNIPNKSIPIGGIIGFPVIAGMKEFVIKNDILRIQDEITSDKPIENLSIHHLAPIVEVNFRQDTIQMKFDTGATRTNFFSLFYQKHREEIEAKFQKRNIQAGSVGGIVSYEVFKTDTIELEVAGTSGKVTNSSIFANDTKTSNNYYYGNLGQDYISSFDEMRVSFKKSSIRFIQEKD